MALWFECLTVVWGVQVEFCSYSCNCIVVVVVVIVEERVGVCFSAFLLFCPFDFFDFRLDFLLISAFLLLCLSACLSAC